MWWTLLFACSHDAPLEVPVPPAPSPEPPQPPDDPIRESMRLMSDFEVPPFHRPWVLRMGESLMETEPCTGSGGQWLPALQPPALPRGGFVPNWAKVGWQGELPPEDAPFLATCVRILPARCASVVVAGPEGRWFVDQEAAEKAAASMPDCPAP